MVIGTNENSKCWCHVGNVIPRIMSLHIWAHYSGDSDYFGTCGIMTDFSFLYMIDCCLVAKWFPTLCNSMRCSPPGSSVHGISQARMLEWVAISSSRGSSRPSESNLGLLNWQVGSLPLSLLGSPYSRQLRFCYDFPEERLHFPDFSTDS